MSVQLLLQYFNFFLCCLVDVVCKEHDIVGESETIKCNISDFGTNSHSILQADSILFFLPFSDDFLQHTVGQEYSWNNSWIRYTVSFPQSYFYLKHLQKLTQQLYSEICVCENLLDQHQIFIINSELSENSSKFPLSTYVTSLLKLNESHNLLVSYVSLL